MKHVIALRMAETVAEVEEVGARSISERPYINLQIGGKFFRMTSFEAQQLSRSLATAANDLETNPRYD